MWKGLQAAKNLREEIEAFDLVALLDRHVVDMLGREGSARPPQFWWARALDIEALKKPVFVTDAQSAAPRVRAILQHAVKTNAVIAPESLGECLCAAALKADYYTCKVLIEAGAPVTADALLVAATPCCVAPRDEILKLFLGLSPDCISDSARGGKLPPRDVSGCRCDSGRCMFTAINRGYAPPAIHSLIEHGCDPAIASECVGIKGTACVSCVQRSGRTQWAMR